MPDITLLPTLPKFSRIGRIVGYSLYPCGFQLSDLKKTQSDRSDTHKDIRAELSDLSDLVKKQSDTWKACNDGDYPTIRLIRLKNIKPYEPPVVGPSPDPDQPNIFFNPKE